MGRIIVDASVDDGCESDVKFVRYCDENGIPCTAYLPMMWRQLATSKGYMPLTQMHLNWLIKNTEIGSHTVTHRLLTRVDPSVAYDEIRESKTMLQNLTGKPITKFCYPRGYANDEIRGFVKEAGYKYARNTIIGDLNAPSDPLWVNTTVHMGCDRKEYDGKSWLAFAIEKIEQARDLSRHQDVYFHVWGHGWEIDKYNQWRDVRRVLHILGGL